MSSHDNDNDITIVLQHLHEYKTQLRTENQDDRFTKKWTADLKVCTEAFERGHFPHQLLPVWVLSKPKPDQEQPQRPVLKQLKNASELVASISVPVQEVSPCFCVSAF